MPIVRKAELREMTSEQRNKKLTELRTELTKMLTMIKAGGAIDSPGKPKALKRSIARLQTIINEEASKQ